MSSENVTAQTVNAQTVNSGNVVVRRADIGDAEAVARMLHDFNTEFETPSPVPEILASRLQTLLATPTTFALLAGGPDSPNSGLAVVTLRSNVWYDGQVALLDELYVVPELRGNGIGSKLIEELLRMAESDGFDLIEINVDEADVDAHRFYARHGFSLVEPTTGERAFYISRELVDSPPDKRSPIAIPPREGEKLTA